MKYYLFVNDDGDISILKQNFNGDFYRISHKTFNLGDNFYENLYLMSTKLIHILKDNFKEE